MTPIDLSLKSGEAHHVFVALRTALEPLIDRLFDPDPEPAELPPGLRLSFHAATTVEQLHRVLGLPLPQGINSEEVGRSLGGLLADGTERIGSLRLQAGSDPEHVSVQGSGRLG